MGAKILPLIYPKMVDFQLQILYLWKKMCDKFFSQQAEI